MLGYLPRKSRVKIDTNNIHDFLLAVLIFEVRKNTVQIDRACECDVAVLIAEAANPHRLRIAHRRHPLRRRSSSLLR